MVQPIPYTLRVPGIADHRRSIRMKFFLPALAVVLLVSCRYGADDPSIYRVETIDSDPFSGPIKSWSEDIKKKFGYDRIIHYENSPNFWISLHQSGHDLVIARLEKKPLERPLKISILDDSEYATDPAEIQRRQQHRAENRYNHFHYLGDLDCIIESFPIRSESLNAPIDISILSSIQTSGDGSVLVDFRDGTKELETSITLNE